MCSSKNFKYLDDLIHNGKKDIVLDSNITLSNDEESKYLDGIKLDVDDLIIDGNGYTIDAQGKTVIFECSGKNIKIRNITLKNGFADDGDAIIKINNGEVNIIESFISDNYAVSGGVIVNERGKLYISYSNLSNNRLVHGVTLANNDGDVYIKHSTIHNEKSKRGEIIFNASKMKIIDSKIFKNMGVYKGVLCNKGELTISNSILSENNVRINGGTLYNQGRLDIFHSIFYGNESQFTCGAIYNYGGDLNIENSTFDDNYSVNCGAIFNHKGNLNIMNSIFYNNRAIREKGAASSILNWNNMNISDSIFVNDIPGNPVAIRNKDKFDYKDCIFKNNTYCVIDDL